jgi:hypothetical protein
MLLPLAGRKLMYKRQAPSPSAENRQAESLSYSSNSLFTPKLPACEKKRVALTRKLEAYATYFTSDP